MTPINNTYTADSDSFFATLQKYPKTSAGWRQYAHDGIERKRVARALGVVPSSSAGEHLIALRSWRAFRAANLQSEANDK